MNVFILGSGRCGTLTIAMACKHATNYTAGHETLGKSDLLGDARFAYPPRHIESDARLSWMLGRLDKLYGQGAFYVHLKRDRLKVAESHARKEIERDNPGSRVFPHYMFGLARTVSPEKKYDIREIALDFVDTVNTNIELFLKDKPRQMVIELEKAKEQFPVFWDRIGAEGNLPAALGELDKRWGAGNHAERPRENA